MIEALIFSLTLTLVLESLYAQLWGVGKENILLILGMNILTNPMVNIWFHMFEEHSLLISALLPELAAIAVESWLLTCFSKNIRHPVILGISINLFSFFTGLLISLIIYY